MSYCLLMKDDGRMEEGPSEYGLGKERFTLAMILLISDRTSFASAFIVRGVEED